MNKVKRLARALHKLTAVIDNDPDDTEDWAKLSRDQKQEYYDLADAVIGVWEALTEED